MIQIPLRDRDGDVVGYTWIDNEDWDLVKEYTWHLASDGYAATAIRHPEGGFRTSGRYAKQTLLKMHRLILDLPFGDPRHVDHENRDRLDNRRRNLRIASIPLNGQNRGSNEGSSSRYRGVTVRYRNNGVRWEASAKFEGRNIYLGMFDDEDEAGAAIARWRAENMPYAVEI